MKRGGLSGIGRREKGMVVGIGGGGENETIP
jgi:hypothetical protein